MNKLDEEKIKSIQNLRDNDVSVVDIAKKLNVSITAVRNCVESKKMGISLYEYREYLVKRRGFNSQEEYDKYLELKKFYEDGLQSIKVIESGYDIKYARVLRDNGNIVIKLIEDDAFYKNFVEADFEEVTQKYFQEVSVDGSKFKGEVFYEENKVIIKPDNLESRAFLVAYRILL